MTLIAIIAAVMLVYFAGLHRRLRAALMEADAGNRRRLREVEARQAVLDREDEVAELGGRIERLRLDLAELETRLSGLAPDAAQQMGVPARMRVVR